MFWFQWMPWRCSLNKMGRNPTSQPRPHSKRILFFCCGWKSSSGEALQGNSQKVKRTPRFCVSLHSKSTTAKLQGRLHSPLWYVVILTEEHLTHGWPSRGENTQSPGPVSLLSEITHPNIPRTSSVHHSVLTRAADLRVHISQSCSNTNLPWNIWRTKFSSWDHSKCSSLNEHLKSPQPSTLKGLY